MKLGACYNLFDCEELLESSILSIREEVEHVCIVYQKISNFGSPANPHLVDLLQDLVNKGLVDSLIEYTPKSFSNEEKKKLVASGARKEDLGCEFYEVADQFFNELTKRELGRLDCLKHGMTHFFSLDCDEYYLRNSLAKAKAQILQNGYEATACRMRIFGKFPTIEYIEDSLNAVPFIHVCSPDKPFRLSASYPLRLDGIGYIGLDPTRRIEKYDPSKFYFFTRDELVMFHMTLVRKNIRTKLSNVSNRQNYGETKKFLEKWDSFTNENDYLKFGILHPHPNIGTYFSRVQKVPNYFNIDIFTGICRVCSKTRDVLMRCSVCKRAKYCGAACQAEDWPTHKLECKPPQ